MNQKIDEFFDSLQNALSRVLFLDYDGTLAPFRKERDRAYPYNGINERLDKLMTSKITSVVIISGRAIADLKPLLKLKKYPEIWGSHGWENLATDGSYRLLEIDKVCSKGLELANKYLHENELDEYMEIKPASVAVHWRGLTQEKVLEIETKVLYNWSQLEADHRLIISVFDGGLELKVPGFNKGFVVRTVLERLPGGTLSCYLGDDFTDEDAFKALPDTGLGVLVRGRFRDTAAGAWIKPPDELLDFLDRWIDVEQL
ncbi:MAG: trehalose-phosphatase [Candidatus Zixiibacteriota bacterium]|nr:MAG: trehalose-phosphatase [candidate division Zixibacteria bacterium]